MDGLFAVGQIIDDRWRVVKNRTTGFVTWRYYVRDQNTDEPAICTAVISDDDDDTFKRMLRVNAMIVKELGMHGSPVPKFVSYGDCGEFSYFCTEMVGPNLNWIRRSANAASYSLPTALNLGLDMLVAIREVHECGYLIRDLRPESFVLPQNSSSGAGLLLAENVFNLARRYLSFDGVSPLPLRARAGFRGNIKYSSIFALRRFDHTRMDDMWQWFYLIIDFIKGDLGWAPLPEGLGTHVYAARADNKEDLHNRPHEWLGSTVPDEVYEILEYLKTTPRETPPDYMKLFNLIKYARIHAIETTGGVAPPLDWEPGGQWHDILAPLMDAE